MSQDIVTSFLKGFVSGFALIGGESLKEFDKDFRRSTGLKKTPYWNKVGNYLTIAEGIHEKTVDKRSR